MSSGYQSPAILQVSCSLSSISLGEDAPMCRICHNTGGKDQGQEPLHKVCWCKGTMGKVHKSCLELWLNSVHSNSCPICHFRFRIRRVYKPIKKWRCPPMQANDIAMLIFNVLFLGMVCVQVSGIGFLLSHYSKQSECNTAVSLGIAGIASGLLFFFTFWIGSIVNIYTSSYWALWRRKNKHVVVILENFSDAEVV
ncbi:E3 ubiquitin-protein ligase MARCH3-like [Stylophora pistillata]|uniref:E3 ubiquitin-protein ligase MARCH3-like n=1 Tax=Stylophora pistillata TaxID=50429 RepID=UPI000C051531|nr:E3 ubiquitin-protein ligase MARCH3-like [Stylophora pistillata]